MSTIFIHCGAPKTGTSYLQVLFARYAKQMAEGGILYPEDDSLAAAAAGKITSGNGIEFANFLSPSLPHKIADKTAFAGKLEKVLAEAGGKSVLYSSEAISFRDPEPSQRIARIIRDAGYTPRLVTCVRDIGRGAISTYSQRVKRHGETQSFAEYLRTFDPQYLFNLRRQIAVFGGENVTAYNYEEHKDRLAELFFRDIFGLDFVPEETGKVNRSLTVKELAMLREMNRLYPEAQRARLSTFVSDALMGIERSDEVTALGQEEFDVLNSRFTKMLAELNKLVTGRPVVICDEVLPRKTEIVDEFETSVMAILARLVTVAVKRPE